MDSKESMGKKKLINSFKEEKKETSFLSDELKIENLSKLKRLQERNLNASHVNRKIFYMLHDSYTFENAYWRLLKKKVTFTKKSSSNDLGIGLFCKTSAINLANKFKTNSYSFSSEFRNQSPKLGKKKKNG